MPNLNQDSLRSLISSGLVSNFENVNKQLTANGFDVRVCAFVEVLKGGKLAINKENNVPPTLGRAFVLPGYESRLNDYSVSEIITTENFVDLLQGRPYFVVTCEEVNIPDNIMLTLAHRTSLFRFTQSIMGFGFGEAGYKGYLTFMLIPSLDCSVQLGSRVAQMSFSLLTGKADYSSQHEANYQGGKLF